MNRGSLEFKDMIISQLKKIIKDIIIPSENTVWVDNT